MALAAASLESLPLRFGMLCVLLLQVQSAYSLYSTDTVAQSSAQRCEARCANQSICGLNEAVMQPPRPPAASQCLQAASIFAGTAKGNLRSLTPREARNELRASPNK